MKVNGPQYLMICYYTYPGYVYCMTRIYLAFIDAIRVGLRYATAGAMTKGAKEAKGVHGVTGVRGAKGAKGGNKLWRRRR
jgi:hypothetical protein